MLLLLLLVLLPPQDLTRQQARRPLRLALLAINMILSCLMTQPIRSVLLIRSYGSLAYGQVCPGLPRFDGVAVML